MSLWGQLAELLAVIQWFIVLFTGQRNDGIWNMQRAYLDYAARVQGYTCGCSTTSSRRSEPSPGGCRWCSTSTRSPIHRIG
ncbi:MAG: DUF4389 domain-containing protein [Acidimicrobiia bacterium]|nr:DUF4389 domain-containing protein [Acidimicrobiia bacterium]